MALTYSETYLAEAAEIAGRIPADRIEAMAAGLAQVRERGGRLFVLGVGGGAAHASHAVNDFRKLCHLESYTPVDNVAELTARTNDEGWETTFAAWLRLSRLSERDAVFVLSVGGGSRTHNVSMNVVHAVELAKEVGARIYGVVGSADGTTAQLADVCVVVDAPPERRTPHVESFQAVVWHVLVSHPALAAQAGKWESLTAR
jgi:D-sedoheptulose 7-phosphate isomerase